MQTETKKKFRKSADHPMLRRVCKRHVELDEQSSATALQLSRALVSMWNKAWMYCDELLRQKRECPDAKTQSITAFTLNYWLTKQRHGHGVLFQDPEIRFSDIGVDVERQLLVKLAGSWQSFFELLAKKDARAKRPGPKKEDEFVTMSWRTPVIKDGVLTVLAFKKMSISIILPEYLRKEIAGKKVNYVTLNRDRDGVFVLSVACETGLKPAVPERPLFIRAIDVGAGDIAVSDSDGTEFLIAARRGDKFWKEPISQVEERIKETKRTKGSRAHRKLGAARRQMFGRSLNQHQDHQRKLADLLVEKGKVECVVIGKAKTRLGLAQSENGTNAQHYGSQNTGWMHRFAMLIKNKAVERGVLVVELPDPPRVGRIDNPSVKFVASRELLQKVSKRFDRPMPQRFIKKGFSFDRKKS